MGDSVNTRRWYSATSDPATEGRDIIDAKIVCQNENNVGWTFTRRYFGSFGACVPVDIYSGTVLGPVLICHDIEKDVSPILISRNPYSESYDDKTDNDFLNHDISSLPGGGL